MSSRPVEILIVGSGIAGPTLASFLQLVDMPATQKPHITVLERSGEQSAHLRGQNIDIRGAGITIMKKLGLETAIRSSVTGEEGVQLVDTNNRIWSQNQADRTGEMETPTADIEILRGRLAEICWKSSLRVSAMVEEEGSKGVEYIFGDYLAELAQDGDRVHVKFAKSGKETSYDIVVGADGLHSHTRSMIWGKSSEESRINHLHTYGGFFSIPRLDYEDNYRRWYHAPGRRGIMLRPGDNGTRTTVFMYTINEQDQRLRNVMVEGERDERTTAQKELLKEYFHDAGWESKRVLREMKTTNDFYYDELAQVKMDKWSKGRVVLLGDAAYCASPFSGMGTTLSFSGAYELAGALRDYLKGESTDLSGAFDEYEAKMRPTVEGAQKLVPGMPKLMNPETAWGIWVMRTLISCLSYTRLVYFVFKWVGKLSNRGIQGAQAVPVADYGFRQMSEWRDWNNKME